MNGAVKYGRGRRNVKIWLGRQAKMDLPFLVDRAVSRTSSPVLITSSAPPYRGPINAEKDYNSFIIINII